MRRILIAAAVGLAWLGVQPAIAAPPPIEAYGRLPAIDMISLSPSGQFMVSVGDVSGKRYILVRTLAGDVQIAVPAGDAKVRSIRWVDDQHLLVTISGTNRSAWVEGREENFLTINIDLATHKWNILFGNDPKFDPQWAVLEATYVIGSKPYAFLANLGLTGSSVGSRLVRTFDADKTWPDLWRIDLTTNAIQRVATGSANIQDWAIGPDGAVVGYANYYNNTSQWSLYQGQTTVLQRHAKRLSTTLDGLGRTPASMLVFDRSEGADTWIEIGGGKTETLWKGLNVTDTLRLSATGLLVGAVVDDNRFVYFDPGLQAKMDAVIKPFHGQIDIRSATEAVDKVILHTSGKGDSGTFYLVNLATHDAVVIDNDYPDVPTDQAGEVRSYRYAGADCTALDGVLTLPPGRAAKNLPVVILPHGGPIGFHDTVGFDWLAQAFASRGYAVLQPNYRGSGGRGAAFETAGYGEWGRKMLSDIADGLKALAADGAVDPKRACIVGFSYGGYAALAGVTVQQGLYRCAVSGSGVSDVAALLAWQEDRWGVDSAVDRLQKEIMGVTVPGAPSLASISPARLAARADAPILLIHGADDSVVPIAQSQDMARALMAAGKPVETLFTKDEDHWLSKSATRVQTLKAAIDFVQKNNPAD